MDMIRQATSASEDVEKLELSDIAGGSVNWYTMCSNPAAPHNVKKNYHIQQYPSQLYIYQEQKHASTEKCVSAHSQPYCFKWLKSENNPTTHQLMNRSTNCAITIHHSEIKGIITSLVIITPSKRSQSQTARYRRI